jgi:hypothetical protein
MADSRADTTPTRPGPVDGTRDVAALQEELEILRARLHEGPQARRRGFWRSFVVVICLVAVTVLSPLCIVAAWANREISSTDTYVSTVAPLASDPAVQEAVSTRVADEVITRLNVPEITDLTIAALEQRGLGPRATATLDALRTPLVGAIENFIRTQVQRLIASDTFADAWVAANREAHAQLVAVLTGDTGSSSVDVSGTTVSLNLAALIDAVKAELVDRGFQLAERIPEVNASFVIIQSADLGKAQTGFRLLQHLRVALPAIAIALLGIAVFVSSNRRKTAIAGMLCIAGGMLLLGFAIAIFRSVYLGAIPADQVPHAAAAAIYDALVRFIRSNLRGVLLLAVLVAAGRWVTGPTRAATGVRHRVASATARVRAARSKGFATGPVGAWLWTYGGVVRAATAAVGGLILVWTNPITGLEVIVVAGIVCVAWLLTHVLAAPPDPGIPGQRSAESAPPAVSGHQP